MTCADAVARGDLGTYSTGSNPWRRSGPCCVAAAEQAPESGTVCPLRPTLTVSSGCRVIFTIRPGLPPAASNKRGWRGRPGCRGARRRRPAPDRQQRGALIAGRDRIPPSPVGKPRLACAVRVSLVIGSNCPTRSLIRTLCSLPTRVSRAHSRAHRSSAGRSGPGSSSSGRDSGNGSSPAYGGLGCRAGAPCGCQKFRRASSIPIIDVIPPGPTPEILALR